MNEKTEQETVSGKRSSERLSPLRAAFPEIARLAVSLRRWVIGGAVAVVAIGLAIVVVSGYERREAQMEILRSEHARITVASGEYLRNAIEAIDLRMREGVRLHEIWLASEDHDSASGHALLRSVVDQSRHLNGIGWMDAKGTLVASSVGPQRRAINIYDEAHFQAQLAQDAGLFISAPVASRQDGRLIITFSRRLARPDGSFAGVVTGFTDLKGLASGLDAVRGNQIFGLKLMRRGRDGAPLIEFSPAGSEGEVLRRRFDILGPAGLTLDVSAHVNTALAPWRNYVVLAFALFALLATTTVLAAYALLRLLDKWDQSNAALWKRDLQLREAQRMARIGNWEFDLISGRLTWSDEIFRLFEINNEESGLTFETFLNAAHPEDREKVNAAYKESLATRQPYEITYRLLMASGGIKHVQVRCYTEFDAEGKPLRSVGTVQDVTDQEVADAAIRKLNEELEQRVRERTAQLEEANKALESYTYSVSHDLRSPLRGIDGYSRLLLSEHGDKLDAEGRGFLQNVLQASQRMGQLIDDLLAYARMERQEMRAAAVPLREFIGELLAERGEEVRSRGVELKLDLPAEVVLSCDRDGLSIALRNLLENALKFSRDSAPAKIEIGVREEPGCWRLWVRDNGTGFNMKYHERIFDIFQRLHRSEDYPGTGVGLAIVKKAMQRMGGRVWAESELGAGATFYLEVPK